MTLSTHIVVGATVAAVVTRDPVSAFFAGWISHYLLDAIPHWDYKIRSFEAKDETKPLDKKVELGRNFLADVGKVTTDALLGFLILFLTLSVSEVSVTKEVLIFFTAGAVGGAFPDFLQFVYGVWNVWPVRKLQEFHHFIHAEHKLDDKPAIGVPIQIGIISVAGAILLRVLGF